MDASRRVVFREFGGPEVLHVEIHPPPHPLPGQVRVRVAAAGLNPVDWKLFSGLPMREPYERSLPSGNGYDFSGVIDENNNAGDDWPVGTRVFGGLRFHAQADHLVIDPRHLARVPAGLSLTVAGALNVVGRTAFASVDSQPLTSGDTVWVSGAAGGVGFLTAQLCLARGARVIGSASARHHDLLAAHGIEAVAHGRDLGARLRALAPRGIAVVFDTVGFGTVDTALELGVTPKRINSIADYDAREAHPIGAVGGAQAGVVELEQMANLIATGTLTVPISATYPLEDAAEAYASAMSGRGQGRIVLVTSDHPED